MWRDLLRQHKIAAPDTEVEVVITAKTEQKQTSLEIAAVLCRWHEATILKYLGCEVRKDEIIFQGEKMSVYWKEWRHINRIKPNWTCLQLKGVILNVNCQLL